LSPYQAMCYVSVLRRLTATEEEVAADVGISRQEAVLHLLAVSKMGKIAPIGSRGWRCWGRMEVSRASSRQSLRDGEIVISPEIKKQDLGSGSPGARSRGLTRQQLLNAEQMIGLAGHALRPSSIAGRFIRRWEEAYAIQYRPAETYERDVELAARLLNEEGEDLAVAIVAALFLSPVLSWVTNKTWDFIDNPTTRNKHLRPVAAGFQTQRSTPAAALGVIVMPGEKRQ
jgi:hypothetical protein